MTDLEEAVVWVPEIVTAHRRRQLLSSYAAEYAARLGYRLGAFIGVTQDGSGWLYRWSVLAPDS